MAVVTKVFLVAFPLAAMISLENRGANLKIAPHKETNIIIGSKVCGANFDLAPRIIIIATVFSSARGAKLEIAPHERMSCGAKIILAPRIAASATAFLHIHGAIFRLAPRTTREIIAKDMEIQTNKALAASGGLPLQGVLLS